MSNPGEDTSIEAVDHAISLAEATLVQCDKAGQMFAAIDISSALDKLRATRADLSPHNH